MDLYPAIDLRDGKVVRLYQGDYDRQTVYRADPADQARAFQEMGAAWIHVVDLDAARSGTATNLEIIASICDAVDIPVQSGGGVRSAAAAEALVGVGVTRVVIGTAAIENPEVVAAIAERFAVAVGLDARAGNLAAHGWETETGADLVTVALQLAGTGVDAFVVTEISRDGTLEGPDLEGLATVLDAVEVDVVASGGVGKVADLTALASLRRSGRRLAGAIVGRALYEGSVDLPEAVAAVAGTEATP